MVARGSEHLSFLVVAVVDAVVVGCSGAISYHHCHVFFAGFFRSQLSPISKRIQKSSQD